MTSDLTRFTMMVYKFV